MGGLWGFSWKIKFRIIKYRVLFFFQSSSTWVNTYSMQWKLGTLNFMGAIKVVKCCWNVVSAVLRILIDWLDGGLINNNSFHLSRKSSESMLTVFVLWRCTLSRDLQGCYNVGISLFVLLFKYSFTHKFLHSIWPVVLALGEVIILEMFQFWGGKWWPSGVFFW